VSYFLAQGGMDIVMARDMPGVWMQNIEQITIMRQKITEISSRAYVPPRQIQNRRFFYTGEYYQRDNLKEPIRVQELNFITPEYISIKKFWEGPKKKLHLARWVYNFVVEN